MCDNMMWILSMSYSTDSHFKFLCNELKVYMSTKIQYCHLIKALYAFHHKDAVGFKSNVKKKFGNTVLTAVALYPC
jgi:hypothetical protein